MLANWLRDGLATVGFLAFVVGAYHWLVIAQAVMPP